MPVMVVGADTAIGRPILERFLDPRREVRAFVTDPDMAGEFRSRGVKVALGDVSDDSHLTGACLNCFSVVLVAEAAEDSRQRSFAPNRAAVLASWAKAVAAAGVRRVIWILDDEPPACAVGEVARVGREESDLPGAVFELDRTESL